MSSEPKPLELSNWDPAPPEDGMPTTSPEEKAELDRMRRIDNPANIYQVCHLTIDNSGRATLFPLDGFPKLAWAQAMVEERAKEGRSGGLVILAQAAAVAARLGE
jgi:hypothetical protein